MSNSKLKVYIADLRHERNGYVFIDTMPLGIGYMKAVIDRDLSADVECSIFAYSEDLLNTININPPDVLMVSNYMWNLELSLFFLTYTKKLNKNILTVMGGPNIPIEEYRQKDFLIKHPDIDIYVLGEGDYVARDIVRLYMESGRNIEKLTTDFYLTSCAYKKNGEIVVNEILPRKKDLDDIPSPWLTGVMDKFFDNKLNPLFETNRGCPFSCTFCVQGTKYYNRVSHFNLERIRNELHYIGKKISTHSRNVKVLRVADPNFGMYTRDVEIAKYMGEIQKEYEYPTFIDATTGKNKHETIIKAMEEVSGALIMWQAVQSIDDNVLNNIKRKNIKLDAYNKINVYLQGRGLRSQADLILCLPGESLSSHLDALSGLTNSKVDRFNNFQAILLKGSEMEAIETRNHFKFKTMYRLMQKGFSSISGKRIFEPEEIIVSTDTFSFDEYIIARKFHLLLNLFLNELRFEKLLSFFDVLEINRWEWINEMYCIIDEHRFVKEIFDEFAMDTKNELFESPEEMSDFYSKDENFRKLENLEIGDAVIHKFRVKANYYNWENICEFAFDAALRVIKRNNDITNKKGFQLFWDNYKTYQIHSRGHGRTEKEILSESKALLSYNIKEWFENNMEIRFDKYMHNESVEYKFSLSPFKKRNVSDSLKRWGTDAIGMSLFIRKIKLEWLEKDCIPIEISSLVK
jgi:radical SAM superfamily enzyme YgiQ (UPF0313 family)